MEEIFQNFYAIRRTSFLLVRDEGNILLGANRDISDDFESIKEKGKLIGLFLGDRHHGTATTTAMVEYFDTSIFCSEEEAKALKKKSIVVDKVLDYRQHHFARDLEIIPTPGHTRGAFSYLWETDGQKILFIGDTIVPVDGEWKIWVTKSNRERMLSTMALLEKLHFDFITSNSFAATGDVLIRMTPETKQNLIATVVQAIPG